MSRSARRLHGTRVGTARRTTPLLAAALVAGALLACSESPTDPCVPGDGPQPGVPAFDLPGSLEVAGARVERLGERLDLTLFQVPTRVLRVDGEEVLYWEYCTAGQLADDLGLYGLGVEPRDPPVIEPGPEEHLYAFARVLAVYEGTTPSLLALLEEVMGAPLLP